MGQGPLCQGSGAQRGEPEPSPGHEAVPIRLPAALGFPPWAPLLPGAERLGQVSPEILLASLRLRNQGAVLGPSACCQLCDLGLVLFLLGQSVLI